MKFVMQRGNMSSVEQKELNIRSIKERKLTWLYIEKPTSNEVEFLAQRFNFHPLDLDDVLSRIQRPKIDEYEDYLFLILHFPLFDKRLRVTVPSQVSVFSGRTTFVSLLSGEL